MDVTKSETRCAVFIYISLKVPHMPHLLLILLACYELVFVGALVTVNVTQLVI